MQVQGVKYNNSFEQSFTAKIANTYALRKFRAGLRATELDSFDVYIKDIEKVNDGKIYEYKPLLIGNNVIAKIHELDKNGNLINPPALIDYTKKPLNVFKQLANRYRNYAKHL